MVLKNIIEMEENEINYCLIIFKIIINEIRDKNNINYKYNNNNKILIKNKLDCIILL
jgi:hypothetical protein